MHYPIATKIYSVSILDKKYSGGTNFKNGARRLSKGSIDFNSLRSFKITQPLNRQAVDNAILHLSRSSYRRYVDMPGKSKLSEKLPRKRRHEMLDSIMENGKESNRKNGKIK